MVLLHHITCWVDSFCSHWYFGSGFPSAEQVSTEVLWTPTVAPPVGVTRSIRGGSVDVKTKKIMNVVYFKKIYTC